MRPTKKGNRWHFCIKSHSGANADSGLAHTMVGTAANVHNVTQACKQVHEEETDVLSDAGYQGVSKRKEVKGTNAQEHVTTRPGKRWTIDKGTPMGAPSRTNWSRPRRASVPRWNTRSVSSNVSLATSNLSKLGWLRTQQT
jgi:IS5 family transposase